MCFRFGQGVQRDLLQAAEFFLLAAEEGDAVAMGNLADLKEELQLIAKQGNSVAATYVTRTDELLNSAG